MFTLQIHYKYSLEKRLVLTKCPVQCVCDRLLRPECPCALLTPQRLNSF